MQSPADNMHVLTHTAINDLQRAFQECKFPIAEGLILSAMVKIRNVHDLLPGSDSSCFDMRSL